MSSTQVSIEPTSAAPASEATQKETNNVIASENVVGDTIAACPCANFDPSHWDQQKITWYHKAFVKETTWCCWYMPLNYGGALRRAEAKLKDAHAHNPDRVRLSTLTSPWYTHLYVSVDDDDKDIIPDSEMVHMTGTFLTKVFEGPYSDFGKWLEEFKTLLEGQPHMAHCMYAYYATCPGCAKKYGKNYVVLFAKVA